MGRTTLLHAVALAILALSVAGGGAAFYVSRGMHRAAEGFFDAVQRNSLSDARPFLAESLRSAEGDEWLRKALSESELFDLRSVRWSAQHSANGYGELTGDVTRESGATVPVTLLFVRENLAWKLYAIRQPFNEPLPAPLAPLLPGREERVTLVKRAIRDFAASIQSRNMSYFRSTLAPSRRELYSTEKLNEAFEHFFDIHEDLASLETIEPNVEEMTRASETGEVTLRGHFDTTPKQIRFLQKYAYEQTDWRLLSFKIEMQ